MVAIKFGKEPWNGVPIGCWATELIGSLGRNQSLLDHAPPTCPPIYSPVQLYAGAGVGTGALYTKGATSAADTMLATVSAASETVANNADFIGSIPTSLPACRS